MTDIIEANRDDKPLTSLHPEGHKRATRSNLYNPTPDNGRHQRIKEYATMRRQPAIYLLTNKPHGTLYTGVTSNLVKRIWEHKSKVVRGFSASYNLTRLVYFELFDEMYEAISREKQIKAGSRRKKLALIESMNPEWKDLYREICR
jgi:putative endonuclease